MWAVLTFWLLLGLPGLAWLERFDPESLERGALSAIARAYFASFALLTPVSVIGYLLQAPLWLLSAAIVIAVAGGAYSLARERRWLQRIRGADGPLRRPRLSAAAAVCCAWLALDLWIGARVGSHVQGDAGFHIARIRLITTHGFNNWDPLLAGEHFEPIYHTNLYHSLLAACAQLTGLDPGAAWIWVWPFLKLMAAAGVYELAVAVLGVRASGYLAAVTCGACLATSSTLAFPNTLGPYVILPFALACAVDVLSAPTLRNALWLGVASLVLAQTHLLYSLFLALSVGPVLALRFAIALVQRSRRRELLLALAALGLALPWFVAPARPRLEAAWNNLRADLRVVSVARAQEPPPKAPPSAVEKAWNRFIHIEPEGLRLNPEPYLDPNNPDTQGVVALAMTALLTRRRQALALLAITSTVCAWLFIPFFCTLLDTLLVNWVVLRFAQFFFTLYVTFVPAAIVGVVFALVPVIRQHRGWRATLELAGAVAAFAYAYRYGDYGPPWTKEATVLAARDRSAQVNAERITRRARFFAANVAPGAIVMAPLMRDYDIPMHCACRPFAYRKGRGERGQTDLEAKRAAIEKFYARNASAQERLSLLRQYGVHYVFNSPRRALATAEAMRPNVKAVAYEQDDAIVRVAP
jgi:hypothetical protein